jgi:hypothetical protein
MNNQSMIEEKDFSKLSQEQQQEYLIRTMYDRFEPYYIDKTKFGNLFIHNRLTDLYHKLYAVDSYTNKIRMMGNDVKFEIYTTFDVEDNMLLEILLTKFNTSLKIPKKLNFICIEPTLISRVMMQNPTLTLDLSNLTKTFAHYLDYSLLSSMMRDFGTMIINNKIKFNAKTVTELEKELYREFQYERWQYNGTELKKILEYITLQQGLGRNHLELYKDYNCDKNVIKSIGSTLDRLKDFHSLVLTYLMYWDNPEVHAVYSALDAYNTIYYKGESIIDNTRVGFVNYCRNEYMIIILKLLRQYGVM